MKFSEFKQLMDKHNKLVQDVKCGVEDGKTWHQEMVATNHEISNFHILNPDLFNVDLAYLKKQLNEYIKGVVGAEGVSATFKVAEYYNEPALVIDVTEPNLKDRSKVYHRIYYVGRIVSGARHNLCVDLTDIMDYGYTHRDRGALFNLEGFEDVLWQAVEENFNEQVKGQISLLQKTRERNALEQDAIIHNAGAKVAVLKEESDKCEQKIAALSAQLAD